MAGLAPFFVTGANAKIKVNGVTLAFCTDVSYQVIVQHEVPYVLGMYEAVSIEPQSYAVTGSFGVIRYMQNVASQLRSDGFNTPHGVADQGNGVGVWTPNNGSSFGNQILSSGAFGNDGRAQQALDPSTFQTGTFFDIEIYQKMEDGNNRGVAKIRSCRIDSAGLSIEKKTATVERFTFKALYLDEDSFTADFSGTGQQNS